MVKASPSVDEDGHMCSQSINGLSKSFLCVQVGEDSHIWQSRVEIKGYSVTYFDRIAAFEAPYH